MKSLDLIESCISLKTGFVWILRATLRCSDIAGLQMGSIWSVESCGSPCGPPLCLHRNYSSICRRERTKKKNNSLLETWSGWEWGKWSGLIMKQINNNKKKSYVLIGHRCRNFISIVLLLLRCIVPAIQVNALAKMSRATVLTTDASTPLSSPRRHGLICVMHAHVQGWTAISLSIPLSVNPLSMFRGFYTQPHTRSINIVSPGTPRDHVSSFASFSSHVYLFTSTSWYTVSLLSSTFRSISRQSQVACSSNIKLVSITAARPGEI